MGTQSYTGIVDQIIEPLGQLRSRTIIIKQIRVSATGKLFGYKVAFRCGKMWKGIRAGNRVKFMAERPAVNKLARPRKITRVNVVDA